MSIAQANAIAAVSQKTAGHGAQLEELTKRVDTLEALVRELSTAVQQLADADQKGKPGKRG